MKPAQRKNKNKVKPHIPEKLWLYFLLIVICISPIIPNWFDQRLPGTHEYFRYVLLSDWFVESLRAGNWYPRWLPEMNGGFGYPEFVFYQPGYFFVTALTSLFTEDLLYRQLLALSLIALVGGLGVYLLARCFVTQIYAVLAVAIFQLAPYVHTNLYVRGDLSEWMVLELSAWPIYFLNYFLFYSSKEQVRQRFLAWLGLCFSSAIICYCHPVAVMFLPPIVLLIGGICLISPQLTINFRRAALELIGALVMCLALSAPYWLTVAIMQPFVNTQAAFVEGYAAWNNTVQIWHLLFGSFIQSAPINENGFLGAPFVILSIAGWWHGRRTPLIFGAGLTYFITLIAMTPLSQIIWHTYPLKLLQFPWRLAVFAPLLQVVCMIGLKEALPANHTVRAYWVVVVFGVLAAWSFLGHRGFQPLEIIANIGQQELVCMKSFTQNAQPASYVTTLDALEWLPKTSVAEISALPARVFGDTSQACKKVQHSFDAFILMTYGVKLFPPPQARPWIEADHHGWKVDEMPTHTPYLLDYQLKGDSASAIIINQLYLPGWTIVVNGQKMKRQEIERNLLPDGRMQVILSSGKWDIQAWYDGPLGWRVRNMFILTLCLIVLIYWSIRLRTAA